MFDGRLVVDNHFATNDPTIHAGGPVSKFKRRYRATVHAEAYNSRAVGAKLAASVLSELDHISVYPLPAEDVLPTFEQPVAHASRMFGAKSLTFSFCCSSFCFGC